MVPEQFAKPAFSAHTRRIKPLSKCCTLLIVCAGLVLNLPVHAARFDGKLTVRVVDDQTGEPIAARMELRNGRGRPVKVRAPEIVAHADYFVFEGEVTLELRKGPYQFLIEAGPEYQTRPGHFSIDRHAEDSTEVRLRRRVDMQAAGWWSADLEVRHRQQDLPLLMRAARINLAPNFVQANVQGKCIAAKRSTALPQENFGQYLRGPNYSLDHRRGGGLLVFETEKPQQLFDVCRANSADSSLAVLRTASESGATTVALTPFAWDLPIWIASGQLNAVQLIHRHALADNVVDSEGWGRKRDKAFFPGKTGNGRWSETIYHHLLNCGLRIPPAAGSGSGANKNPLGTNRVYVHCGEDFTRDRWFAGLREGKVMVTNGPLLRTEVSGHPPGHQFQLDQGETREFQIALGLAFYEQAPVEYLEIIKNGRVEHEIRLNELAEKNGRLPPLRFDGSGWFLVRAMTSSTNNYQYATTGPYYVQADYQPRISRSSVQFFLDWLEQATEQFSDNEVVLADIQQARPFWEDRLAQSNTD
jgi:hypothetical protein